MIGIGHIQNNQGASRGQASHVTFDLFVPKRSMLTSSCTQSSVTNAEETLNDQQTS